MPWSDSLLGIGHHQHLLEHRVGAMALETRREGGQPSVSHAFIPLDHLHLSIQLWQQHPLYSHLVHAIPSILNSIALIGHIDIASPHRPFRIQTKGVGPTGCVPSRSGYLSWLYGFGHSLGCVYFVLAIPGGDSPSLFTGLHFRLSVSRVHCGWQHLCADVQHGLG